MADQARRVKQAARGATKQSLAGPKIHQNPGADATGLAGATKRSLAGPKIRAKSPTVRWLATGLLVLLTCSGCGAKLPATQTVTGTVSYQGQPVEGATVMFSRDSRSIAKGEIAIGQTDAQGRFTLTTHFGGETDAKGVIAGEYEVTVSKQVPPPGISASQYQAMVDAANKIGETGAMVPPDQQPPSTVELFPEHYSVVGRSKLSAKVTSEGPNDFPFALD
jgi:hypothetical protein